MRLNFKDDDVTAWNPGIDSVIYGIKKKKESLSSL